jgi:hypothetical protein
MRIARPVAGPIRDVCAEISSRPDMSETLAPIAVPLSEPSAVWLVHATGGRYLDRSTNAALPTSFLHPGGSAWTDG